jgi:hypothetical protein
MPADPLPLPELFHFFNGYTFSESAVRELAALSQRWQDLRQRYPALGGWAGQISELAEPAEAAQQEYGRLSTDLEAFGKANGCIAEPWQFRPMTQAELQEAWDSAKKRGGSFSPVVFEPDRPPAARMREALRSAEVAWDQCEDAGLGVDYAESIVALLKMWRDLKLGALPEIRAPTNQAEWLVALDALEQALEPALQQEAGKRPCRPSDAKTRKRTKRPLEDSNPLKLQVYERVRREHGAGKKGKALLDCLKEDKDFAEQVREAKLTLDRVLVKNALAFFAQPKRNNQETERA